MNRIAWALALSLGLAATPTALADVKHGETVFRARCSSCHAMGVGGSPTTAQFKEMSPERIVAAMTTGTMTTMAAGLDADEKNSIAEFLTGLAPAPAGQPAAAPEPTPTPTPTSSPEQ